MPFKITPRKICGRHLFTWWQTVHQLHWH